MNNVEITRAFIKALADAINEDLSRGANSVLECHLTDKYIIGGIEPWLQVQLIPHVKRIGDDNVLWCREFQYMNIDYSLVSDSKSDFIINNDGGDEYHGANFIELKVQGNNAPSAIAADFVRDINKVSEIAPSIDGNFAVLCVALITDKSRVYISDILEAAIENEGSLLLVHRADSGEWSDFVELNKDNVSGFNGLCNKINLLVYYKEYGAKPVGF